MLPFRGLLNKNKKELDNDGKIVDENLDKINEALDKGINKIFSETYQEFESIQNGNQHSPTSTPAVLIIDDIDVILDKYMEAQTKIFTSTSNALPNQIETNRNNLVEAAIQLHLYLENHGVQEVMNRFQTEDYTRYNIIETELELMHEDNQKVIDNCRAGVYIDREYNGMYLSGKDRYQIESSFLSTDYENVYEDNLIRGLFKLNAIERGVFTSKEKREENCQRQISFIQNDLKYHNGEKIISGIAQKDFDKGYWVQTELEILTLPVEQKQAIRSFREQNKVEGILFERGTLVTQYNESTEKGFETGVKK